MYQVHYPETPVKDTKASGRHLCILCLMRGVTSTGCFVTKLKNYQTSSIPYYQELLHVTPV